jgi:YD repeat-containing protein
MAGMKHGSKIALAAAILVTTAAVASETITYTYDARGRLVKVERSGTVNNGVKAEYTYDKGDNRTNVNTVSPK